MPDRLSEKQSQFLETLRRRCFRFFVAAADPQTGLIPDRARANSTKQLLEELPEHYQVSSSAACGFGLAAYAIGSMHDWEARDVLEARVKRLLHSLLNTVEHKRGFLYHFFGRVDGRRAWNCEASSIDTALAACGAMVAGATFGGQIAEMADQFIDRIDWAWMLDGHETLSMGWKPETGFLVHRWDRYSELMGMVLIGIGSRTHPLPASCWHAWRRGDVLHHDGKAFLSYPPLFVHQYSHAFFDFRKYHLAGDFDAWENSVTAHRAHLKYLKGLAKRDPVQFGHYGDQLWGVTSSDSETGYRDWGGPFQDGKSVPERGINGTVVPSAAAGALAIWPEAALKTLMHQKAKYGDKIFGQYGFVNAFNPVTGWVGPDVIGIDTGISLLMAENLLHESVWNRFMSHPVAQNAMKRVGFEKR